MLSMSKITSICECVALYVLICLMSYLENRYKKRAMASALFGAQVLLIFVLLFVEIRMFFF